MSARPTWSDAAASLRRATPGELRTLWQVARLPLVWAGILANLNHPCGVESVHRHLGRLREAGLVAWTRSSRWPLTVRTAGRRSADRPPRLFYPTDLGLAVLALDAGRTPEALARRLRLRRRDLLTAVAGLPQLAAAYTLLALVAASRPSPCVVVTWERPWRRRFRVPTAAGPVSVSLPAYASLRWDDPRTAEGPPRAEVLLLPDLGLTPVAAHRPTIGRLLDWHTDRGQELRPPADSESSGVPALLIATSGAERAGVWRSALTHAADVRREVAAPRDGGDVESAACRRGTTGRPRVTLQGDTRQAHVAEQPAGVGAPRTTADRPSPGPAGRLFAHRRRQAPCQGDPP